MKKRPTRSLALPMPFSCTSSEIRSRRAFSMAPHANTYWRADTCSASPLGAATDRPLQEAPFDSRRTAVTVALSMAVIFRDAWTSPRYFSPNRVGGLNWKYELENSSFFHEIVGWARNFDHFSISKLVASSSHILAASA